MKSKLPAFRRTDCHGVRFFYCPVCGKLSIVQDCQWTTFKKEHYDDAQKLLGRCKLVKDKKGYIKCCDTKYELYKIKFVNSGEKFFHDLKIVHKDNKIQCILLGFEVHFFHNVLQRRFFSQLIVFNIETGHTYEYCVKYLKDGKKLYKDAPNICTITYRNSSFIGFPVMITIVQAQKIIKALQQRHQQYLNYILPSLREYIEMDGYKIRNRKVNFFELALYNRFPCINTCRLVHMLPSVESLYSINDIVRIKGFKANFRSVAVHDPSQFKAIIQAMGIPNVTSIRKSVNLDSQMLLIFWMFMKSFKNDVNLYMNLYKLICLYRKYLCGYGNYEVGAEAIDLIRLAGWLLSYQPLVMPINKLILALNQAKFSNAVVTDIRDIANMFGDIKKEQNDYILEHTLSLKEMHYKIIHDYNFIKNSSYNMPIIYKENELALESTYQEYHFKLAENAVELHQVGSYMHICAGSYSKLAIDKACIIVIVYKDKYPQICLELDNKAKQIKQAKIEFNQLPRGKDLTVLYRWIQQKQLKINTNDISKVLHM